MNIKKTDINKTAIFFLFSHLFIWTLIPSISNTNLPLDTIEALAWGSNLEWGYNKHPPFSAWSVEFFYQLFQNKDWAYYFLSQLFVVSALFIVFEFSKDFFENKTLSLISILLLEGIYFYNFTTPEFNVNISQMPFWALSVLFFWKGFKNNKNSDWLLFGLFAGLGVLSKYLFIYLLAALDIFFIYLIFNKKFNYKVFISLITFLLVLAPHLFWLVENDYTTISYAFNRTGAENSIFLNHLTNPLLFLSKQLGITLPFFLMLFLLISNFKVKLNYKDKKFLFLLIINLFPIIFMFLTSLFLGAKIRTMWMTPFYLFFGVLFIYIFKNKINLKKTKKFISVFLFLFILSPLIYLYVSLSQDNKRTDFPGKNISNIVQKKWDENFDNKIGLVAGDEWFAGNLSYHLKSRPKWDNLLNEKTNLKLENIEGGFIITGNTETLLKICKGVYFELEKQGVCMIGKNK